METRCVVINSTVQPVANLSLIGELVEKNDRLLILGSEEVQLQTDRLITLIKQKSFAVLEPLIVTDVPSDIERQLSERLSELSPARVLFIANGGSKPAFWAISEAIKRFDHEIAYGQRGAYFQRFSNGLHRTIATDYYHNPDFSLEDIFALKDQTIEYDNQLPSRIWPNPEICPYARGYATDILGTAHRHSIAYVRGLSNNNKAIDYHEACTCIDEFEAGWIDAVYACVMRLLELLNEFIKVEINQLDLPPDFFANSFAELRKTGLFAKELAEFSVHDLIEIKHKQVNDYVVRFIILLRPLLLPVYPELAQALEDYQPEIADRFYCDDSLVLLVTFYVTVHNKVRTKEWANQSFSIGELMEDAVAQRVQQFVEQHSLLTERTVHSIWRNIKIKSKSDVLAEFDILIVTRNANLIHIECKTSSATVKDMASRLLNMYESSSNLAQLHVCCPLFQPFSETKWFEQCFTVYANAQAKQGMQGIAFSLPEQTDEYSLKHGKHTYSIKPFEVRLKEILSALCMPQDRE